ncbi:DUF6407 family protein [Bacillus salitolerans]|uniref:DUF6407 family protein n=1 Tax=Bacillus salitolerans TaxID=1437434 RepID=A0ABW4LTB3_9BACI
MNSNFKDFVKKTTEEMDYFDHNDLDCFKELVTEAIGFYKLKSYEETEDTKAGNMKYLYVHSMAEENLLSKIIELAITSNKSFGVEDVYEGRIIREY